MRWGQFSDKPCFVKSGDYLHDLELELSPTWRLNRLIKLPADFWTPDCSRPALTTPTWPSGMPGTWRAVWGPWAVIPTGWRTSNFRIEKIVSSLRGSTAPSICGTSTSKTKMHFDLKLLSFKCQRTLTTLVPDESFALSFHISAALWLGTDTCQLVYFTLRTFC